MIRGWAVVNGESISQIFFEGGRWETSSPAESGFSIRFRSIGLDLSPPPWTDWASHGGLIQSAFEGMKPWRRAMSAVRPLAGKLSEVGRTEKAVGGDRGKEKILSACSNTEFRRRTRRQKKWAMDNFRGNASNLSTRGSTGNLRSNLSRTGYHFGQNQIINDFGRPYQEGFQTSVDGFISLDDDSWGVGSAYVRAE